MSLCCKACGKVVYVSRRRAGAAAKKIHAATGRRLRPYEHKGVWHLSTVQPRPPLRRQEDDDDGWDAA